MKDKTVIILNREKDVVQLFESFLVLREYKPILCCNVGDALPVIEKISNPIDLLIIDCNIGKSSCVSTIKKVKDTHPAKVLLTVISKDEEFFKKAQKAGVDAFLMLPCSVKEFFDSIKMLI